MPHYAGQYYHIYNRSISSRLLFPREQNYIFLLRRIKSYLPDYCLAMISYCLMPNHYHFLMRVEENDQLAPFIQRLFNSYSQAINKQEKRSGTLFESNAKYCLVDTEAYVLQLTRYIHLNPVHAGIVRDPGDWRYSNYLEWIGKRNGTLMDHSFIDLYFSKPGEYTSFVMTEDARSDISSYLLDE